MKIVKKIIVIFLLLGFLVLSISCDGDSQKKGLNKLIECYGLVGYKNYPNSIFSTYKFKNTSGKEITGLQFQYCYVDEFGNEGVPVTISIKSNSRIYDATYANEIDEENKDEYRNFSVKNGESFITQVIYWKEGHMEISSFSEKWMLDNDFKGNWKEKFKYKILAVLYSDGTLEKIEVN